MDSPSKAAAPTTRDAILDGALQVMTTRGLARTTTKEIARAAGYSEAALYKLFDNKVDLFLCVLAERLPRVGVLSDGVADLAGTGTVAANLERIIIEIAQFYTASFPIAMSLFSDPALLARHRDGVRARAAGPEMIPHAVADYLRSEQHLGRIDAHAPVEGVTASLVGACFQRAFLVHFSEADAANAPDPACGFAAEIVATVLPALAHSSGPSPANPDPD